MRRRHRQGDVPIESGRVDRRACRNEKIQVVQCSAHQRRRKKYDGTNKDDPKLEEFAEIQRQIINAKNVPFNDLRKAFVDHWKKNNPDNKGSGILTYDGNHWNDAGMRFVADQMLKRFQVKAPPLAVFRARRSPLRPRNPQASGALEGSGIRMIRQLPWIAVLLPLAFLYGGRTTALSAALP